MKYQVCPIGSIVFAKSLAVEDRSQKKNAELVFVNSGRKCVFIGVERCKNGLMPDKISFYTFWVKQDCSAKPCPVQARRWAFYYFGLPDGGVFQVFQSSLAVSATEGDFPEIGFDFVGCIR